MTRTPVVAYPLSFFEPTEAGGWSLSWLSKSAGRAGPRVDDIVVAMGGTAVSKSEVSRISASLDADGAAWRTRPLDEQPFPYVFLDASYCKVRVDKRIVTRLLSSRRA